MIRKLRRCITPNFFVFWFGICVIWLYCEFLIYYVVVIQCSWPQLQGTDDPLRVLLVADTHLLGTRKGHWLDKRRREGQMRTAFQAAIYMHAPEAVFFLGDLFDEGLWNRDSQFQDDVRRFRTMFKVPDGVQVFHIAGNHDMGFHHDITSKKAKRFEEEMNAPPVWLVSLKGNHFILINSMAMEGDRCSLCRGAVKKIEEISELLACWKEDKKCKHGNIEMHNYSRPILMQHFPLYRSSDAACSGDDAAPMLDRNIPFRNKIDALSREATEFLKERLRPRAAFGGHTHHGCRIQHGGGGGGGSRTAGGKIVEFPEYSVASFSWRNRPDPRYYLVKITPHELEVNVCSLPREITIATTAVISILILIIIVAKFQFSFRKFYRNQRIDLSKIQ